MMMKNKYIILLNLLFLFLGWACSNDAIVYNPDQKRNIYFFKDAGKYNSGVVPDTVEFSFAALEETEYQYDIPVKFIGMPVEKDVECEVEVVADSTTAKQGKHFEIEKEWKHIVCDVEPYYKGKVDMGRVFYYTAYTEKAQRHLEKLRVRLNDMRETLENTALCALAEKMEDEDMKFDPQSVWFTDEGASTHGWINPATGENTAIKLR